MLYNSTCMFVLFRAFWCVLHKNVNLQNLKKSDIVSIYIMISEDMMLFNKFQFHPSNILSYKTMVDLLHF